jgi:hypothetical protein
MVRGRCGREMVSDMCVPPASSQRSW